LALAAIIAQQLVPGLDGVSRWPATEIMIATDAVRSLVRKGDEDDEKLIKSLATKQRQLINLIDLKDPEKGVQLYEVANFNFGDQLIQDVAGSDEDEGWDLFFSLDEGCTLRVSMVEDSFGGRSFVKAGRFDFKPRKEGYEDSILDDVYDLEGIIKELPYDKLKAKFLSVAAKDEDADEEDEDEDEDADEVDEDEEEETPKSKKKVAGKSKSKEEDEDEEDEDEDTDADEDEEEEEETPKKKKKPAAEEEEDEDEEEEDADADEEDEEDETPKSKKKKGKEEEEDDDGDADWDDFDDEEEEETPKKKKKVVK